LEVGGWFGAEKGVLVGFCVLFGLGVIDGLVLDEGWSVGCVGGLRSHVGGWRV